MPSWQELAQRECSVCGMFGPDTCCQLTGLEFPELTERCVCRTEDYACLGMTGVRCCGGCACRNTGRVLHLGADLQVAAELALTRYGYWSYEHRPDDPKPHQYDAPTRWGFRQTQDGADRLDALREVLAAL